MIDMTCPRITAALAPALDALDELAQAYPLMEPQGTTPTGEALAEVYASLPGGASVLLITDGAPNGCGQGSVDGGPQQGVVEAVTSAAGQGVATHVVGLTFQDAGALIEHLGDVAEAGGTTAPHLPQTRAELQRVLRAVAEGQCP
jgi:hypothetical protein